MWEYLYVFEDYTFDKNYLRKIVLWTLIVYIKMMVFLFLLFCLDSNDRNELRYNCRFFVQYECYIHKGTV